MAARELRYFFLRNSLIAAFRIILPGKTAYFFPNSIHLPQIIFFLKKKLQISNNGLLGFGLFHPKYELTNWTITSIRDLLLVSSSSPIIPPSSHPTPHHSRATIIFIDHLCTVPLPYPISSTLHRQHHHAAMHIHRCALLCHKWNHIFARIFGNIEP